MFGPLTFESTKEEDATHSVETKCILCEDSFNLKYMLAPFLVHLFEVHNVVIQEAQCIQNLPEYVTFWRDKFKTTPISSVVPSITLGNPGDKYYVLSDLLEEDKQLRHKNKLDNAVKAQDFERTDTSFKRECLFCRSVIEGKRTDFLTHLSDNHNLQLGNPQNLVFIDELLDKIDSKLKALQCIYCEKLFPQRNILKEHMRKKLHKRINPNNREYDKYYMINYLDPDRTWKVIKREHDRFATPPGADSDHEYSDWMEEDLEITCLFCNHKKTDINVLCLHMEVDHDFNFAEVTANFDFYQKVKLVNYIRKQVHDNKCFFCDEKMESMQDLQHHLVEESHYKLPDEKCFNQADFYFPTYENDTFLYCIEDVED